jgi:5-formyltetrahydrofolate cyclo-ligase
MNATASAAATRTVKTQVRTQIRSALGALAPAERAARSQRAGALLRQRAAWRDAGTILFYSPVGEELDVWPLLLDALAGGKTVALPRFMPAASVYAAAQILDPAQDLRPGQFGIREPGAACPTIPLNRLDFVLVPGVGFDLSGHRLGRGRGFYDRLLKQVRGLKCGVAFDEQVVPALPVAPHDVTLDCILTPTRWLTFGRARS